MVDGLATAILAQVIHHPLSDKGFQFEAHPPTPTRGEVKEGKAHQKKKAKAFELIIDDGQRIHTGLTGPSAARYKRVPTLLLSEGGLVALPVSNI